METPIYKEQGDRLYMINKNIIVEIDLSQYEHGIIVCTTADVRTCLVLPNEHAKVISEKKFQKHFKVFMRFIATAHLNIPLNKILEAN